jgi:FkbM family methyltransferase
LGDKTGHASIDFREDLEISSSKKMLNIGGVFVKEDASGDFQLDTLDNVLYSSLTELDLMKIDVQGFEDKLLRGARKVIDKFKPLIYLEVTTHDELNTRILPVMNDFKYKIKKAYTIDYLFEAYN